jgi:opacity protein-like surface antigen
MTKGVSIMKRKIRSVNPHLLIVSFFLIAGILAFTGHAGAQDEDKSCGCWIDSKTGKTVPTAPLSGRNLGDNPLAGAAQMEGFDPRANRAFNAKTGQNFYRQPDGCWIDSKTGKTVPSVPLSGSNLGDNPLAGSAQMEGFDPKADRAFNPKTGQNFVRAPCPPSADTGTTPQPKPTPSEIGGNTKPVELFIGFGYMRAPDESAKSLVGFNGSLFYDFTPHVAVGGDVGIMFGSTTDTVGTTKIDISLHRQTFLFGPQFSFQATDKVKVFVHPLFGGVRDTSKTTFGTSSGTSSGTAFAMAFGGGVDVNLTDRLAIRPIAFDYMPTHFGTQWQNNYRISTGLVIRFGGH